MRPLPTIDHVIIHSKTPTQQDIDELAKHLKLTDHEKSRMMPGDEIHIVRQTKPSDVKKT